MLGKKACAKLHHETESKVRMFVALGKMKAALSIGGKKTKKIKTLEEMGK